MWSLVALWPAPASAGELESLTLRHRAGSYHVHAVMQVEAPTARVYDLLTDYDHLDRVSPVVQSSSRLKTRVGEPTRVELRSTTCLLWFCRNLRQVQEVDDRGDGVVVVRDLPGHSDFRTLHARWEITGHGRTTRVSYEAELVPGFWLPPLLGPALLKHSLRRTAVATIRNLERRAVIGR
jgi:carbon monoxide dehydrogenase subunit G